MIIMKPQNVVFLLVIFLSLGVSEEIEDDNSKVWKALNEMKIKLAETENRLTKTENKLAATENKLAETIDELRTVKEKCEVKDILEKRVIPPSGDINSMEQDIITLKAKVQSLTVPKVGFTAILGNDISNLGDNQIIVFDHVITNIGGSYNSHTGIFMCKEPGLYLFYVHTLAEPGKHVDTIIRKNSQDMAYTYALDRETYSSGSNMAIMNLNAGDTVYVRSNGHEHDSNGAILDSTYTSFSGVLIRT